MKMNCKTSMITLLAYVLFVTSFIYSPLKVDAETNFDVQAQSAILLDVETGKILFAKDPDIKLPPASMTKMMTEYLVLEAIENGEISWETTTQISDYAYSISADPTFSGIGLTQDKDYTVRQLYEAMAIGSDNATTIALAELIAGSEGEFVQKMNEKGKEMGLTDYQFVNSTGLSNTDLGESYPEGTDPEGEDLLSSKAAALLAYRLVTDFPNALEISSQLQTELDGRTLLNLNWMLPHTATYLVPFKYEGVDGLKTGYTEKAGYTFTGTAEKNGRRLISVVMKTSSKQARFQETSKLLDYGFNQFEKKELFPKGYQIKGKSTIPVAKGKADTVEIASNEAVQTVVKDGEDENYSVKYTIDEEKLNKDGELVAPIEKGEKIGKMELVYTGDNDFGYIRNDKETVSVDIVTTSSVEKSNWFMLGISGIGQFFSNMFTSVSDTVKGWF
ncbi:D-alanyl-D-alanine carboxypeptidase family protein [Terrihalobacillus insolitus]